MTQSAPTQIIILGGGGDLAQRKLLPALFELFVQKLLPDTFNIIGLARTERTDAEYRSLIRDALLRQKHTVDQKMVDSFCEHLIYVSGSFDDTKSYDAIGTAITAFEKQARQPSNRVFYLAVPPLHYESIFRSLHASALASVSYPQWARILVEKPFGNDYDSAIALDTALSSLFTEDQIFRIDHYLAKEAVQNILSFRFANTLLRAAWNAQHIKAVKITMFESLDVVSRGAFYDTVGALKDVGQNHLLQILALVAMEEPEAFTAEHIRKNRADILERLLPVSRETVNSDVVRAQYEGYTDIKGVRANSTTETYFEFKSYIDTEAWKDVPFFIRAGKAIKNDEVVVEIEFKEVADGPFAHTGNSIILTVSPVQSMNITLNVKKPGHGYTIESDTLSFAWDEEHRGIVNAYEKVLLDCIEGDQTLFTKTSEVLASWKFIASIMNNWDVVPLQKYEQGSGGPEHSIFTSSSA